MEMEATKKDSIVAKDKLRDKIREIKRLAHIDAYDGDQDNVNVSDADETIENMLLFMTEPMIKKKLKPTEFKKINNCLVDILSTLEVVEKRERKKFKKV